MTPWKTMRKTKRTRLVRANEDTVLGSRSLVARDLVKLDDRRDFAVQQRVAGLGICDRYHDGLIRLRQDRTSKQLVALADALLR